MILRTSKQRRRKGFSVIELVLSMGLLSILLGAAAMVVASGEQARSGSGTRDQLEGKSRRGLDRVASELVMAGASTLIPNPIGDLGSSDFVFAKAVGATGGEPDWGPFSRLALEYEAGEIDDGVDNDGDGLVDEGRLLLTHDVGGPNERTVTLCRGVREMFPGESLNADDDNGNGVTDERGFNVHRVGDMLEVRLAVEAVDPRGALEVQTLETSVRLRN